MNFKYLAGLACFGFCIGATLQTQAFQQVEIEVATTIPSEIISGGTPAQPGFLGEFSRHEGDSVVEFHHAPCVDCTPQPAVVPAKGGGTPKCGCKSGQLTGRLKAQIASVKSIPCDEDVCRLGIEHVEEKKTCFKVEQKTICIPAVRLPWMKCKPTVSKTKVVNRLTSHQHTTKKCQYKWDVQEQNTCGSEQCAQGEAEAVMNQPNYIDYSPESADVPAQVQGASPLAPPSADAPPVPEKPAAILPPVPPAPPAGVKLK